MSSLSSIGFGMTAFTQNALVEIDRLEEQKKSRLNHKKRVANVAATPPPRGPTIGNPKAKKPRSLTPLPAHEMLKNAGGNSSGALTPQPRKSSNRQLAAIEDARSSSRNSVADSADTFNWKRVQKGALMLRTHMSEIAKQSTSVVVPKQMKLASADETFHHLHHLAKKQENVRRLEAERLAAEEKAKADAKKQEQQRERRLQRQHTSKIAAFDKAEIKLEHEHEVLEDHHEQLQAEGLLERFEEVNIDGDDAVKVAVGDRVQLMPAHIIEKIYKFDQSPIPEGLLELIGTMGTVVGHGGAAQLVTVKFEGHQEHFCTFRGCLRSVKASMNTPSAPLVITEQGETLQLTKLDVVVEILGNVCIINHNSTWVYPTRIEDKVQEVALAVPLPDGAVVTSLTGKVGHTTLNTATLLDGDAAALAEEYSESRSSTLSKMMTPGQKSLKSPAESMNNTANNGENLLSARTVDASPHGGSLPTPLGGTVRSPRPHSLNQDEASDFSSDDEMSQDTMSLTSGKGSFALHRVNSKVFSTIWTDKFNAASGLGGSEAVVIPLREAREGMTLQLNLKIELPVLTSLSSPFDHEVWEMFYPCQYPEKCLAKDVHFDNIASLQFVIAGCSQRNVKLESNPPTKLQRVTALAGTRPLYVVAAKDGVWHNDKGISAHFCLDPMDEFGIQVFVEANQSAFRSDSFVAMMMPTQTPKDGRFARVVSLVIDMNSQEQDVLEDILNTATEFVNSLTATDFLSVSCYRGPLFYTMGSELHMSDESFKPADVIRRCLTEVRNVEHAKAEVILFLSSFSEHCSPVCTSYSEFFLHHNHALAAASKARIDIKAVKQADSVRELVLIVGKEIDTLNQQAVAHMIKQNSFTCRVHACYMKSQYDTTAFFLRALCNRNRGQFSLTYGYHSRFKQLLAFVHRLARPIVADVDITFPHTSDMEIMAGGKTDMGAGRVFLIAGRYSYSNTDSSGDSVSISGRLPHGKKFVRRQLCPKIPIPVTKAYHCQHLLQLTCAQWYAALLVNKVFDPQPVIEKACQYNQPFTIPEPMVNFQPNDLFVPLNESSFAFRSHSLISSGSLPKSPLDKQLVSNDNGSQDASSMAPLTPQEMLAQARSGIYLYHVPHPDKKKAPVFPPLFTHVTTGSAPIGAKLWSEAAKKKVLVEGSPNGVFARVGEVPQLSALVGTERRGTAAPKSAVSDTSSNNDQQPLDKAKSPKDGVLTPIDRQNSAGSGPRSPLLGSMTMGTEAAATVPIPCPPVVAWLQEQQEHYTTSIVEVLEKEIVLRRENEEEEWTTYLASLHHFHAQRLRILSGSITLQRGLSEVEEAERIERKSILEDEIQRWAKFMDKTEHTRGIMARVNLFAEESRKRLAYAEENARDEMLDEQRMMWKFALMARRRGGAPNGGSPVANSSGGNSTGPVASSSDFAFVKSVIEKFNDDMEKMNFVACVLAAWTAMEDCASVFGMEGGIIKTKRLLATFPHHESIVESLLITIANLSLVRTNHGKLESCSILFDVMHAAHCHAMSFSVQAAVVRCYSRLSTISHAFRQTLISSEKGLCAVLETFTRHMHNRQFTYHMFNFLASIATETPAHRSIAELGLEAMATATMVVHPDDDKIRFLFFKTLGMLASSRVLRVMLANTGQATAVIINTILSHRAPPKQVTEAFTCIERVCGNVGDYPSLTVATAVTPVLRKYLQMVNPEVVPAKLIEHCHRILCRLTVASLPHTIECDDVLSPLVKLWENVQITGIASSGQNRVDMPVAYGSLCHATIAMGAEPVNCVAKVFSRDEVQQYLLSGDQLSQQQLEESEWQLYGSLLSLQLQDVLENSFVRHPMQVKCYGFSASSHDGIHATFYERPVGPSLATWLERCLQKKTPFLLASWLALAATLFDVCDFHANCRSTHGALVIENIFCEEDPSETVPISFSVGPAAGVTTDIVDNIPDNQVALDVEELATIAAKARSDDPKDVRHALLDALNYGDALEGDPEEILSRIPRDLSEVLFGMEEGVDDVVNDDSKMLGVSSATQEPLASSSSGRISPIRSSRFRLPASQARDLAAEYLEMLTPNEKLSSIIALPRQ